MHDVLPQVIWTRCFLMSQGYEGVESVVYQDNQSSILLEKNGRMSSGKRTRHINIPYFFVADRIKARELVVEYCPTGDMLADFFTKPLQGKAFKNFRDIIMNIDHHNDPIHRSVLGNEVQNMITGSTLGCTASVQPSTVQTSCAYDVGRKCPRTVHYDT
jgi:hypothetical protein